jgi:serine/threonine-protein kinase
MADVYLGSLEGPAGFVKPVAIKRMKPALAETEEFIGLFLTEARTASLLSHPNICQVNELGAGEGNDYFMVMEYLVGVPLTKVLARQMTDRRTFPLGFLLGIAAQACEGIHYAHSLCDPNGESYHIIHRDLSPPNIFLTVNGMAKILDFGISKSTQSVVQTVTGQIRGKFTYMSPEQLKGQTLDARSDVFSLAVIVHELVTGARLFKRRSRLETFQAVTKDVIPRPDELNRDVPKAVSDVIYAGLARDRSHRFASARAFGNALVAAAHDLGGAWVAPQIAELAETVFEDEFLAHSQWLDAAQSGALRAADAADEGFHATETIADDVFFSGDAEIVNTEAETNISEPWPGPRDSE